jgi:hypothetical protein
MKRLKWIYAIIVLTVLGFLTGCKDPDEDPFKTFVPKGVTAHYTFEHTTNDGSGRYSPSAEDVIDIKYKDSHSLTAGYAAEFNGTTSVIEIPNSSEFLTGRDLTVAFWIKADGSRKGHFVMGMGGRYGFYFEIDTLQWFNKKKKVQMCTSYDGVDSLCFEYQIWDGSGRTKNNGGFQGTLINKDVSNTGIEPIFKDAWVHVVCVYNSANRVNTMYINSEKVKQTDFDLWPDGDVRKKIVGVAYWGNPAPANKLAIGFIQARQNPIMLQPWANYKDEFSNHFKGLMDDLWIFNVALTDIEVQQLYNTENK